MEETKRKVGSSSQAVGLPLTLLPLFLRLRTWREKVLAVALPRRRCFLPPSSRTHSCKLLSPEGILFLRLGQRFHDHHGNVVLVRLIAAEAE